MNNPLCRYCGKPMTVSHIEYIDVWYECHCDGYKKEKRLLQELRDLENKVKIKHSELQGHKAASLYESTIREFNKQISEINQQMYNFKRGYEE